MKLRAQSFLPASKSYICPSCALSLKLRPRKYATAASAEVFDVVCVGGGPAGLSLLTALRSSSLTSHLKLALVESQDLTAARTWTLPATNYSNRASSLTISSISFLSKIGAWQHVDSSRIQPYHHMRIWDGLSSSSSISFDQNPLKPPIAYMTENANLTRALLLRLSALHPISFFDKTSVASIDLGPSPPDTANTSLNLSSYPHLTLSSGRTLAARLLVGADGLNSPARTFAGITSRGWDYDRHGVVATVKLSTREHNDSTPSTIATAYQRFLPSGPIALLALPDGFATLVWTVTPAQATRLKALTGADLAAMINAAFRLEPVDIDYMFTIPSGQASELSWRESITRVPTTFTLPGRVHDIQSHSVASFPLRFRHADTYISSRIALVGDAGHTIHPLAGQGLNMGIGDVSALAATIEDTAAHGGDIGVEMNLEGYASKVYARNTRMLGVVDKLHWLYSTQGWLGVQLRGWGLKGVDRLGGLKEVLMRAASGGEIFG